MKLFLFLDDWLLDGYRDVVRVFPQPRLIAEAPQTEMNNHATVWRDPETGQFRCWYFRYDLRPGAAGERGPSTLNLATSDDGIHFVPFDHGGPTDPRTPERRQSLYLPGIETRGPAYDVFFDPSDADASRRYKTVGYHGWLYLSPDGIHWRDAGVQCFQVPYGSDAGNSIFWNPVAERWAVICRSGNPDRRIALVESSDLSHWTKPRIVLHPDAMDEPLLQFYGMPTFWYEDLFISLLWAYRVPMEESGRAYKMYGRIYGQLAYSYDGQSWLRPHRQAFLPLRDPPEYGFGNHMPSAIVPDGDRILLYTNGYNVQHETEREIIAAVEGTEGFGALLVYALRRDGFAYLESSGGYGLVRTRGLIPNDANLSVNYSCAVGGRVLVQVADADNAALPGFSFEDCVPLKGTAMLGQPRWKERNLAEIVGTWCRLEFRLFDARLYAYRWDANVAYAKAPHARV